MTSSCIRLVWQPIQHKDRQRAESGETDSWVAANRQGGPTKLDKIENFHVAVQVGPVANAGPSEPSLWPATSLGAASFFKDFLEDLVPPPFGFSIYAYGGGREGFLGGRVRLLSRERRCGRVNRKRVQRLMRIMGYAGHLPASPDQPYRQRNTAAKAARTLSPWGVISGP